MSEVEGTSGSEGESKVAKSESVQYLAQLPNATWPNAIDVGAASGLAGPLLKKSWRRVAMIGTAVVLIAAIVGGVFLFGGSSPNADAAVIRAVDHALGGKTASVAASEQIATGGQTINFSGNGSIDFTNNAFELDLSGAVDGQTLTIEALYLEGLIYEGFPQIAQLAPGKSWLTMNISSLMKANSSTNASALGSDPLAALETLAQQGNTVTPLGASTVDGQTVEGYSVAINSSVVHKELNSASLPAWMKKAASQVTSLSGSEKVFINGTTLVQISLASTANTATSGGVSINESLDFSNYGVPVTITAPPAEETMPFFQFLQLAKQAETSSAS
jgi:hypothetical protein